MIEITDIETRQSPLDQNPITVYFTIENTGIDLDYLYKVIINNQPNSIVKINKTVIEKGVARVINIDRLGLPPAIKFNSKRLRIYLVIEGLPSNIKDFELKFIFANNKPIIRHKKN